MRAVVAVALVFMLSLSTASGEDAPPDTSAIEAAHAAWTAKANRKTRKALDTALEAYDGPPTTATVLAILDRMSADVRTKNFRTLRVSSLAAANHMEPIAEHVQQRYYDTRMIASISLFNHRQNKDSLTEMVEVIAHLHALEHLQGDELETWVKPMKFRAEAWKLAMKAYYDSAKKRRPSDEELDGIMEALHPPGYHDETTAIEQPVSDKLPFCSGDYYRKKKLRYPRKAGEKGMFGAVILQADIDKAGKFENVEVVAAVPSEGFKSEVLKAVSTWSWKADEGQTPEVDCRLESENRIMSFSFELR